MSHLPLSADRGHSLSVTPHSGCLVVSVRLSCAVLMTGCRSLFVEKHLKTMKVWCRYHFKRGSGDGVEDFTPDEDGCQVSMPLEAREEHEAECLYLNSSSIFSVLICSDDCV